MAIDSTAPMQAAEQWEAAIGEQVRDLRLRRNVTQAQLARQANVSLSTVQALEHGSGSSLRTLVQVARALDRADWLDALAPTVEHSPMAQLRAREQEQARRRQRASGGRPTT